jgi:esterase/lipase superfamily enzyme
MASSTSVSSRFPQAFVESQRASPAMIRPSLTLLTFVRILTLAMIATTVFSGRAHSASLREGDEIWIINTRHLTSDACCTSLQSPDFKVSRWTAACQNHSNGQGTPTTFTELVAAISADPLARNVIYAHGNRFTHCDALERAWFVYQKICPYRCLGQPIRLIIFSWPSQQEGMLLNDVRVKAERTDAQGLYLAWCLRELHTHTDSLTLVGYSFGGRVVTGALHALAGGTLGGKKLPGEHLTGLDAQVALLAAAIDRDWLEPNQYHSRATLNMSRMTLMYNPRDTVLKRYWLLDPGTISRALGAVGPMRFNRRADGSSLPVKSINCSRTVGREHDELDYFSAECRAGKHLAELIENR